MFSIPFPLSEISISTVLPISLVTIFTIPSVSSYAWIIQFVTASETAVFISEISSIVGSS